MKVAYIKLKNGYNTALPCEFMTEANGILHLWGEKGMVGLFILDQVEMCVITEKQGGKKKMIEYNKIDTVYERDVDGTKKLIEGKFRSKAVEFLADCKWTFTEKIDGTNIRIHWDGHKVEFGGRTERANIPSHLLNKLIEIFLNNETEELFEQKFGEKDVILFGEGYGIKIQNGGNYRPDVGFILFDVMVNGNYLNRDSVEEIAIAFGIEVVPVVMCGTIKEAVSFIKTAPNSTIGTAKMEGLVGRPSVELYEGYGKRLIIKIKVCDFAKEN